ncbi:hypothetical protein P40_11390 [Alloalcanivorax xenomutans]|nr:hypothetical protein P40_11390 [Alloalcanivorax xenomutans]PHS58672.1 MAG: ABC transporter substrate-binding protein [Alcanivorax sp.]CUR47186.1 ABC transporter, periplasmic substrate-binding protein [Alloalcanivorax xenomutans]
MRFDDDQEWIITMRAVTILLGLLLVLPAFAEVHSGHAITMYDAPKYGPSFRHFDYVNADAPKGGQIKLHVIGGFDSFMPYLPKGSAAAGVGGLGPSYIYDSLTVRSLDEPFTEYGLLAERMEWPDDRGWITFTLRDEARFADGHPVTAEDVVWSFNQLTEHGQPLYAYYYADVEKVEALSERKVKFTFKPGDNRELVMIVGQLPVLPKHFWKDKDFTQADLTVPMGSGPYRIASFKPGKQVVYERRDDYWAWDLPVIQGQYNFDRVIFEYYLDQTVALEAFKKGDYDFRFEMNSKLWATAYTGRDFNSGKLVKEEVHHQNPSGMQGFIFNTRRPLFQDPVLREAMAYALDFEWSNKQLFYNQYKRTRSYFQNSEMAATGLPSEAELKLLEPLRDKLPERVFTEEYQPPVSDGTGRPRENLRTAQTLLKKAGYEVRNGQLFNPEGKPVKFEFLLYSPAFERVVLPFSRNLKALGISADVIRVDESQYLQRVRNFNFDMIVGGWGQSSSPGNEQRDFWSSKAADRPSSRNYAGIKDPAIDSLVKTLISAKDREALVTSSRALDRALQWGFYVIPNWGMDYHRFAYRSRLAHPDLPPYLGVDGALDLWWDTTAE